MAERSRNGALKRYELGWGYKIAAYVVILPLSVSPAVAAAVSRADRAPLDVYVTLVLAGGTIWYFMASACFDACVELYSERLVVVNPWGSLDIPINCIERFAGAQVLVVVLSDGTTRLCLAVEGSAVAVSGGRGRPAKAARELNDLVGGLRGFAGLSEGVRRHAPRISVPLAVGFVLIAIVSVLTYIR